MNPFRSLALVFLLGAGFLIPARPASGAGVVPTHSNLEYAVVDGQPLHLDLYLPATPAGAPLLVWVHGGAWRSGSKTENPLAPLIAQGLAIASVDYRLTPVAPFPANVHDIKAAIRFLRARAKDFGYDAGHVAIGGSSAGAHLAALVGVTNGHAELEGDVGNHRDQTSDVHAIISFYGASNLETILKQSTPFGLGVRIPALQLLLRGQPEDKPELARLASPLAHVDRADPPLLLFHGDQDPQMPVAQSLEFLGVYQAADRPVRFVPVHGAAHGGNRFYDTAHLEVVMKFLREHGFRTR